MGNPSHSILIGTWLLRPALEAFYRPRPRSIFDVYEVREAKGAEAAQQVSQRILFRVAAATRNRDIAGDTHHGHRLEFPT